MNTTFIIPRALRATGTIITLATILCVLMAGLTAGRGQSADATRTTAPASAATPEYSLKISDGVIVHEGEEKPATLENVVDYLRERHPEANIVVAPGVPLIKVGDLKLRAASIEQQLEAVRIASGGRFVWKRADPPVDSVMIDPATGLAVSPRPPRIPSHENGLYVLDAARPETGRLRVEAFNLTGYLSEGGGKVDEDVVARKINELEQMVDETIQIYRHIQEDAYGSTSSPRIGLQTRFHRGANLLVVIGEPSDIEIAGKVIGALPGVQRAGAGNGLDPFGHPGFPGGSRGTGFDGAMGYYGELPALNKPAGPATYGRE